MIRLLAIRKLVLVLPRVDGVARGLPRVDRSLETATGSLFGDGDLILFLQRAALLAFRDGDSQLDPLPLRAPFRGTGKVKAICTRLMYQVYIQ